jgi:hypothetical protein
MTKERQRMQDSSLISRFHLLCMQLLSYYQAITPLNPPQTPLARAQLSFSPARNHPPFLFTVPLARNSLPSLFTARNFQRFLFTVPGIARTILSSFGFLFRCNQICKANFVCRQSSANLKSKFRWLQPNLGLHGLYIRSLNPSISLSLSFMPY